MTAPFVLLTTHDCHLCEHAEEVLADLGMTWRTVDDGSEEGQVLAAIAPPLRPVLFSPEMKIIGYGRLSPRRLRRTRGVVQRVVRRAADPSRAARSTEFTATKR